MNESLTEYRFETRKRSRIAPMFLALKSLLENLGARMIHDELDTESTEGRLGLPADIMRECSGPVAAGHGVSRRIEVFYKHDIIISL